MSRKAAEWTTSIKDLANGRRVAERRVSAMGYLVLNKRVATASAA
jgi:hypothetical protein